LFPAESAFYGHICRVVPRAHVARGVFVGQKTVNLLHGRWKVFFAWAYYGNSATLIGSVGCSLPSTSGLRTTPRLAKDSGGFLLENMNDLAAGVARMQQERTTYYLLTYQSTNTALDGTFRRVSVKVKGPKTTVKARPGYVAVPLPK
jgi:hypothetical protein